ncbi:hypothetical protein CYMTET_48856 [Cymbomonas tetramitiformis]|uniref:NADP-dependent oxidoreductase domain-containing protein n=1 Tax=Cymbomonas tetramitiformis TaxID=36881 RepID=A0AAE0BRD7_9CHLO|nr:hypothetical protein CYMTET_48856 [Cymbomonas tetramitiformis]
MAPTHGVPQMSLSNGRCIPMIGYGTASVDPDICEKVEAVLEAGYRHLDCAKVYGNEVLVGRALTDMFANKQIRREQLHITSKAWNDDHRPEHLREACLKSLSNLGLEYLDLYMLHYPVAWKKGTMLCPDSVTIEETWKAMEQLQQEGLVKAIGVSNFDRSSLEKVLKMATIVPVINQIEVHPFLTQQELVSFCKSKGIVVTAFSPLAKAGLGLASLPIIQELSAKYGKTPTQVILRWHHQRGIVTLPRSGNIKHIKENTDLFDFELSVEELNSISALNRNRRLRPDFFGTFDTSPWYFKISGAIVSGVARIIWAVKPHTLDFKMQNVE